MGFPMDEERCGKPHQSQGSDGHTPEVNGHPPNNPWLPDNFEEGLCKEMQNFISQMLTVSCESRDSHIGLKTNLSVSASFLENESSTSGILEKTCVDSNNVEDGKAEKGVLDEEGKEKLCDEGEGELKIEIDKHATETHPDCLKVNSADVNVMQDSTSVSVAPRDVISTDHQQQEKPMIEEMPMEVDNNVADLYTGSADIDVMQDSVSDSVAPRKAFSTDHQQQEKPMNEEMPMEVASNVADLYTGSADIDVMQDSTSVSEAPRKAFSTDHQQQEKPMNEEMPMEVPNNVTDLCTGSADVDVMQDSVSVSEALKDVISTVHQQQKQMNEKMSEDKLLKRKPSKRLTDCQLYKAKSSTKDTSSNGGEGTCPADEPRKESGQMMVNLPPLPNGANVNRGDGDDDDGDDGKKPRQMQPKRPHECEDLEKKEKKKEKKKKDEQESQTTTAAGDFDGGEAKTGSPTGSQMKIEEDDEDLLFGGGDRKESEQSAQAPLPIGEASGTADELQTGLEELSLSESDKPGRLNNTGPAGDNEPMQQYMLDGTHSCPHGSKQMPPTRHNSKAVETFYNDNGWQTRISLPQRQPPPPPPPPPPPRGPPALTFKTPTSLDPQDAIKNALQGDMLQGLGDGVCEGGAAGPSPDAPRVCYGKQRDLEDLVWRINGHECAGFLEDQDGVLLCKEMVSKNGRYKDGGQYDKLMFLGKGTFGDVYLIQDKVSKVNFVAKRVLLSKFEPNEALIWSSVERFVNRLLGIIRSGDMVYFLSEYHPGQSLQMLIKKETVLGQGRALFVIKQLFEALDWLHGKRIVHKDIKPQNIMIDDVDHIRLIDFGEAKRLDGDLMLAKKLEGTECYMAPEIARSESFNGKVDVWSAFCTLICAISGHPPWCRRFKGITLKIYLIASSPAPLQDVPSNTDPRVEKFIESGLVSDFCDRPSAAQVLEDFPIHLVDELYNVLAVGEEELKPPPEAPFGMPEAMCNEPVTPCTPRGPQRDVFHVSMQADSQDENDSLDITQFYDVEDAVQNPPKNILGEPPRQPGGDEDLYGPASGLYEPDLDMYGPGLDINGRDCNKDDAPALNDIGGGTSLAANHAGPLLPHAPKFNMDVQALGPDEIDGASAMDDIGDGTSLAADHASPLLGLKELLSKSPSPVNSQAAFMQDQTGDQHDDSLELEESSIRQLDASLMERPHSRTVFDSAEPSSSPSTPNRAPSGFGARRSGTSGFRSITPGVSSEIGISSYNSLKTSVTVFTGSSDPDVSSFKMKCSSGFSVSEVAAATFAKKVQTPFTLVLRKNGASVPYDKQLHNGEFQLDVVGAPDGCGNWLWRVNDDGRTSRRQSTTSP